MSYAILNLLWDSLRPRCDLLLENLALRQQILVLQRTNPKPPFRNRVWVVLCQWWTGWRRPLRLVQPETVITWHRKSCRKWWRWKSKPLQPVSIASTSLTFDIDGFRP
jgi:hypothetical protein